MDFPTLYRNIMLATADAGFVKGFFSRYGWRLGVGRFVAGADLAKALPVLERISASGKGLIIDLLGEFVTDEAAARATAVRIRQSVTGVAAAGLDPYFSVKPSQLGLGVSLELAHELAHEVANDLAGVGGRLCLDMEDVPHLEDTLDLYQLLHEDGCANVSTVLQSYLKRTPGDLERVIDLAADLPKAELRLVKGAYRESAEVSWQERKQIVDSYRELAYRALDVGLKLNIATHDEALLRELLAFVRGAKLDASHYEVQMLYGVRNGLQDELAAAGQPLRVYVPFGDDWYGYYSRRLAERPGNLAFVVRGLFG